MLSTLIAGKTRTKILSLLFGDPKKNLHMRNIEKLTGERINAVRTTLISLVLKNILIKEHIGKKIFFRANPQGIFYEELLRLVAKTSGIGARILKERLHLGKIKTAFLTSDYYMRKEREGSEVDVVIIGTVSLAEVAKITKEEGEKEGVELNYSVMTPEELNERKKNKDSFLTRLLQRNRVYIIGSDPLIEILEEKPKA